MLELIRTNDIVLISRIEAMLSDHSIHYFVADTYTSLIEGSIGIIPRRILVLGEDLGAARRHMTDAGLADELPPLPQ
jgi:Putative prokaryotic signal transducing protein